MLWSWAEWKWRGKMGGFWSGSFVMFGYVKSSQLVPKLVVPLCLLFIWTKRWIKETKFLATFKRFRCTFAQDSVGTPSSSMLGRVQPWRAFPRVGTWREQAVHCSYLWWEMKSFNLVLCAVGVYHDMIIIPTFSSAFISSRWCMVFLCGKRETKEGMVPQLTVTRFMS